MKTERNNTLMFILLVVAQILVCNFINTGPYVFLSILPVTILCMPLTIPAIPLMLIAAVIGLAVDWLAEGLLGLNVLALVPVAFVRDFLSGLLFGKTRTDTAEGFSIKKNGILKVSAAILICQSLFLLVYIITDSAGARTFLFNLIRFAASLVCGYLISLPVFNMLTAEERR